jgi:hypothetical protein
MLPTLPDEALEGYSVPPKTRHGVLPLAITPNKFLGRAPGSRCKREVRAMVVNTNQKFVNKALPWNIVRVFSEEQILVASLFVCLFV